jgi:amidase
MEPTDLAFAGLARQAELIAAGEVSSRELVELYLGRIERLDPTLRAYRIVLAEEALAAADAADAGRAKGGAPPLNGVPIAIKDDTDVAGQVTMRGSLAHDGRPREDAEVVSRLRAAGCVLLGKTHVPELEAMCATESLAFGATHNPWDPDRTPGGSSGGSGSAVAAGLAAAALGTDGAGSIRIPAAACGLFGLKPQRGRVPMQECWNGLSVTGALTRGVRDTALFLDAAAGTSYAGSAPPPGKLRIALSFKVPRGIIVRVEDEQRAGAQRVAERLRELGHDVVERDPDYGLAGPNVLTRYLHGVRTEADGMAHPERLGRGTRGLARLGTRLPAALVRRALAAEAADRDRANAIFEHVDIVLTPVFTRRPPLIGEWTGLPAPVMLNGMVSFVAFLGLWNHTGQPACSVPSDPAPDGFPVGAQLVGRPGDEATLLALAAELEEATGWTERRPPLAA